MMFQNRTEAGKKLAEKVLKTHPDFFENKDVIVLALPRGGVPIAAEISKKLGSKLDIIVTHKMGYPENEELAIGAVSEDGSYFLDPIYSRGISKEYLEEEKSRQLNEIIDRITRYRKGKKLPDISGKIVILVDDGIATGNTMRAAIKTASAKRAGKIIIAVPVAPEDTLQDLQKQAEVIYLEIPEMFFAIGQFYQTFEQLTDEEVRSYLAA